MINLDELYEICYECTGYGDDYYFDKETGEYESACEDCWVTNLERAELLDTHKAGELDRQHSHISH